VYYLESDSFTGCCSLFINQEPSSLIAELTSIPSLQTNCTTCTTTYSCPPDKAFSSCCTNEIFVLDGYFPLSVTLNKTYAILTTDGFSGCATYILYTTTNTKTIVDIVEYNDCEQCLSGETGFLVCTSPTPTPTNTLTPTYTPTNTLTPTNTPTRTPDESPTPTETPNQSPTPTQTPDPTPDPTQTPTQTSLPINVSFSACCDNVFDGYFTFDGTGFDSQYPTLISNGNGVVYYIVADGFTGCCTSFINTPADLIFGDLTSSSVQTNCTTCTTTYPCSPNRAFSACCSNTVFTSLELPIQLFPLNSVYYIETDTGFAGCATLIEATSTNFVEILLNCRLCRRARQNNQKRDLCRIFDCKFLMLLWLVPW
jgi:hypothetical protein